MRLDRCPVCHGVVEQVREPSEIPVGRLSATVELEYDHCTACGEEFVDPEVYKEAQTAAAAIVRQEQGLLPPDEIRRIRQAAGITQEEFEKALGFGTKTVGRWERGTVCQSRAANKLIELFEQFPELFVETHQLAWTTSLEIPGQETAPAKYTAVRSVKVKLPGMAAAGPRETLVSDLDHAA
ncbi:type II toxin-antitoxin system MqsA family antitoxin [Gemmatimonadota bacterium]